MNTTVKEQKSLFSTSVRLPRELEEKLRLDAELNERSLSNEIIFIIKQYFKDK